MPGLLKRLSRGFSYSFIAKIASYGIAFLVAPIYARALMPAEYGNIAVANSVRSILTLVMPMSTAGAVNFWYNLHRNDSANQRVALGGIAGLGVAASSGWLVLGLLLGGPLQRWLLPDFPLPFWPYGTFIVGSAWLLALQATPMSVLSAAERQGTLAFLSVCLGLLQVALVIVMVVWLRRGVPGQVEAMALYALAASPLFMWMLARYSPPRVTGRLWREVAAYSLPLLPHQLSVWALNISDRLIIGHYGERFAADLGLYAFGYTMATVMQGVMAAFNAIWCPVYLEQARSNPRAQRDLGSTASWSILFLALAAAGLMLFAPEGIVLIGGARYASSSRYVSPVVFGYFMQAVYMFPAMALYHVKKTSRLLLITVVSSAVNVGLNLALIPVWGVIVAAWSTALGFSCMAALAFVVGHPPYPLRYRVAPLAVSGIALTVAFAAGNLRLSIAAFAFKAILWAALAGVAFMAWKRDSRFEEAK